MKIKLLILAGFASYLWGPINELSIPNIPEFRRVAREVRNDLGAHWQSVENMLNESCPVSSEIHNQYFKSSWQAFWKKLCSNIYNLHHHQTPITEDNCTFSCNNYPMLLPVDCVCFVPLLPMILGEEVHGLDAEVYKRKHRLIEKVVGHSIIPDQTEVNIKNAICKYCAQCFGGTLALLGGNLDKITTDYEFLNIICSFEQQYSYLVSFKLDLKAHRIKLKPQVQRITEPEPYPY
jgi:hypothetical protein